MGEKIDDRDMDPGRQYVIDGKVWGKCAGCGKVLRLDTFFGDIHICD